VLQELESSEMLREQRDERLYRNRAALSDAAVRAERAMRKHARREAGEIRKLAAREQTEALSAERRRLLGAVHAKEESEYTTKRLDGIVDGLQCDVEQLLRSSLA